MTNGTPIGRHKVYVIAIHDGNFNKVFEVNPDGIETYEELEMLVTLEKLSGKFGYGYQRLAITKPGVDLSGFDLRYADLRYADLRYAKLYGSDLSGADLENADIIGANLGHTNLERADLQGADLECAYCPDDPVPEGWRRNETGHLAKEITEALPAPRCHWPTG